MLLKFYDDSPGITVTSGRRHPESYKSENREQRHAHLTYLKSIDFSFLPRELFLLLEVQYARAHKLGNNHHFIVDQVVSIIYEVIISIYYTKRSVFTFDL